MRAPQWMLIALAAGALTSCGDRRLVLKVDVLSYLDPSTTRIPFGPVPAVPGGLSTGEKAVVSDASVNLLDGTGSIASVQSVSLKMTVFAVDSVGAGSDTLRLYLSDSSTDPSTTPPVMTIPLTFSPGMTDSVTADVGGDERVANLFAGKGLRLTLSTSLHGPDTGPDLYGRLEIRGLDAVLVASRKQNL